MVIFVTSCSKEKKSFINGLCRNILYLFWTKLHFLQSSGRDHCALNDGSVFYGTLILLRLIFNSCICDNIRLRITCFDNEKTSLYVRPRKHRCWWEHAVWTGRTRLKVVSSVWFPGLVSGLCSGAVTGESSPLLIMWSFIIAQIQTGQLYGCS